MPRDLRFQRGGILYFRGEASDRVFLLRRGKLALAYRDIETGAEIRDPVTPGEFFGVKSALGRYPREEDAIVLEDSEVCGLTVAEFERLASANARIVLKMLRVFSGQLRRVHRQVAALMRETRRDAEEGLYRLGRHFLAERRNADAAYALGRYLEYWPGGRFAGEAHAGLAAARARGAASVPPPPDGVITGLAGDGGSGAANAEQPLGRFVKRYAPGEIIFAEFEPGNAFYLIQSGRVELTQFVGGVERTLDVLPPQELFGEMAILDNSPRSATARAVEDARILEFNRRNFDLILRGNPAIAFRLLRLFVKRIYDGKRRLMILTLGDPAARVADVFLMLDETRPGVNRSTERRRDDLDPLLPLDDEDLDQRVFPVTAEDVARWAGMATDLTRAALRQFEDQGWIKRHDDRVVVKSISELSRYVGSRRR